MGPGDTRDIFGRLPWTDSRKRAKPAQYRRSGPFIWIRPQAFFALVPQYSLRKEIEFDVYAHWDAGIE